MDRLDWIAPDILHKASIEGRLGPVLEALRQAPRFLMIGPAHLRAAQDTLGFHDLIEVPVANAFSALAELREQAFAAADTLPAGSVISISSSMTANILVDDLYHRFGDRLILLDAGSVRDPYAGVFSRRYMRNEAFRLFTLDTRGRLAMDDMRISVMLPTRGRPEALRKSLASLLDHAEDAASVEILLGIDSDDRQTIEAFLDMEPNVRAVILPPLGYRVAIKEYCNRLAAIAAGKWLLLWNDDALMQTPGWDTIIADLPPCIGRPQHNNGSLNTFPVVPRDWVQHIGHYTLNTQADTWWQKIGTWTKAQRDIPVFVLHDRANLTGNNRDATFDARENDLEGFRSVETQALLRKDTALLRVKLASQKQELVQQTIEIFSTRPDLVVVLTPGKTATNSVVRTIAAACPNVLIRRTHFVTNTTIAHYDRLAHDISEPEGIRASLRGQIKNAQMIRRDIGSVTSAGGRIAYVCGVREPLDRIISARFQTIQRYVPSLHELHASGTGFVDALAAGLAYALQNVGTSHREGEQEPEWAWLWRSLVAGMSSGDMVYSHELPEIAGIDPFEVPFDRESGYALTHRGNVSLLIYRLEGPPKWACRGPFRASLLSRRYGRHSKPSG